MVLQYRNYIFGFLNLCVVFLSATTNNYVNTKERKKSVLHYTRVITRVTSSGAHLRGLSLELHCFEKRSQWRRDVDNTVSNLNRQGIEPRFSALLSSFFDQYANRPMSRCRQFNFSTSLLFLRADAADPPTTSVARVVINVSFYFDLNRGRALER